MKVAVYSIALNEEQFVERWYESAREADVLLIADTGSTDGTVRRAQELGITVVPISVQPWRFDDARNASLACLPGDLDYCVALDLDEVLLAGWREALEEAQNQGITRPRYRYTWSHDADGKPGLVFSGDKIHTRHGYRWVHAAHEALYPDRITEKQGWSGVEIEHHPDTTKSRSQYLALLQVDARERPTDPRSAFYLARELMFTQQPDAARAEFERFLSLPAAIWKPQRAEAMRHIASTVTDSDEQRAWLERAVDEEPLRRESYVALAKFHYEREAWPECLKAAEQALAITERNLDYGIQGESWGALPHDLAALAAHKLGLSEKALRYGLEAVALNPRDERLLRNLQFYEAGVSPKIAPA